ncbi:septum formation family protein [Kribbella sp. NBC_00889]|uniref:septum formation family protein n=1 Tax=Kribbella sp. NBC_00889 TaxID=2975974 RepID=UPI0038670881|nr:septum formation family protein [Kribbella sp. NBC_00889]
MRPIEGLPPGGSSALAMVALVLGCLGAVLLSIPMAIAALVRIADRNQTGKGKAFTALAVSGLWIVGIVVWAETNGESPDRDVASGQVTAATTTRPQDLKVGDCVANLEEGSVKQVTVTPCEQPNGGRVFAVFTFPPGSWPGRETVDEKMDDGCWERWSASNKQATDPSDIFILGPTVDSWRLGDRGVTCLLTPR